MPKANFKPLLFILLTLTAYFLTGCSNPEKERIQQMNMVTELSDQGDYAGALAILETLSAQYPDDAEILKEMGLLYQKQANPTMAAFFLNQAYRQTPENIDLLYQAYLAQEKANESDTAYSLLEALSEMDPATMTPDLWIRLGELRAEASLYEPALQAYLKGVDPDKRKPSPKTAAAIGDLFIRLNNLPLAERWFTMAADSNDPNALTALFGLLEINLRNKNWDAAEANITQLDAQFPGALDASEWADARNELVAWRKAQDTMKAELEKARKAKEVQATQVAQVTVIDVPKEPAEASSMAVAEATEGKAQIIEDMDQAEAMADQPAIEAAAESAETPDEATPKVIAYDPSIAIEPAEPDTAGLGVTFDQQVTGAGSSVSVSNESTESIEPSPLPSRPVVQPKSIDELLTDAELASQELNYKGAIRNYWQALGQDNQRPDIWSSLSKAYLADGQMRNAETTALEAIRLAPREIDYTLEYLRIAQRTKNATDFLAELETAYARFPRSPELTLSLARAYTRVAQNPVAASTYYNRFIELAPNHPLRAEAETALQNLP